MSRRCSDMFFCIFGSPSKSYTNMCVIDCYNMFFWLLDAKPCRIIWKLHQKVISRPEKCEILPKVGIWTCPSGPKAPVEGEPLLKDLSSPGVVQGLPSSGLHTCNLLMMDCSGFLYLLKLVDEGTSTSFLI